MAYHPGHLGDLLVADLDSSRINYHYDSDLGVVQAFKEVTYLLSISQQEYT